MEDPVLVERSGGIVTVRLNAPPMNPSSEEMLEKLAETLEALHGDSDVRVLILRGNGNRAFSAGGNIKQMQQRTPVTQNRHGHMRVRRAFDAIHGLDVPVIAVVQGLAFGGGFEMALACDMIVAEEGASFSLPEVNLGIFPGAGGTQRLARRIPVNLAKELIFTGRKVGADEAAALGIVNRVFSPAELEAGVAAICDGLVAKSRLALSLAKRVVNEGLEMPLPNALTYEADLAALCFSSADFQEGFAAFLEKRSPKFTGQ